MGEYGATCHVSHRWINESRQAGLVRVDRNSWASGQRHSCTAPVSSYSAMS